MDVILSKSSLFLIFEVSFFDVIRPDSSLFVTSGISFLHVILPESRPLTPVTPCSASYDVSVTYNLKMFINTLFFVLPVAYFSKSILLKLSN